MTDDPRQDERQREPEPTGVQAALEVLRNATHPDQQKGGRG